MKLIIKTIISDDFIHMHPNGKIDQKPSFENDYVNTYIIVEKGEF
jgi:hypothetical protein